MWVMIEGKSTRGWPKTATTGWFSPSLARHRCEDSYRRSYQAEITGNKNCRNFGAVFAGPIGSFSGAGFFASYGARLHKAWLPMGEMRRVRIQPMRYCRTKPRRNRMQDFLCLILPFSLCLTMLVAPAGWDWTPAPELTMDSVVGAAYEFATDNTSSAKHIKDLDADNRDSTYALTPPQPQRLSIHAAGAVSVARGSSPVSRGPPPAPPA